MDGTFDNGWFAGGEVYLLFEKFSKGEFEDECELFELVVNDAFDVEGTDIVDIEWKELIKFLLELWEIEIDGEWWDNFREVIVILFEWFSHKFKKKFKGIGEYITIFLPIVDII
jgi:hypothetical protein